ncbi:hypothetical protein NKJ72_20520 [Mesorhizobium sp. M0045]|uniref:hypothetical protein n=1 Tax=Mesorhizobium sp. M0045 TaxID=2956857 RepID=UPI00333995F8
MQITQTTAPAGQPILRVIFCGEGGDCVTVDMASVEDGNNAVAIDRAQAILVQTATFDVAANDYDARSNGNFDEVAVTAANNANGAVYIFEYRHGDGGRQVAQSTLQSLEAAREEAVRCAIHLLVDLQPRTDDLSGWLLHETGEVLYSVEVQEAQAARLKRQ